MRINAIKCQSCNPPVTIFSRSRHDFRSCPGNHVSVDGGADYFKVSYEKDAVFETIELDLPLTTKKLYDDWNTGKDKFGVIYD